MRGQGGGGRSPITCLSSHWHAARSQRGAMGAHSPSHKSRACARTSCFPACLCTREPAAAVLSMGALASLLAAGIGHSEQKQRGAWSPCRALLSEDPAREAAQRASLLSRGAWLRKKGTPVRSERRASFFHLPQQGLVLCFWSWGLDSLGCCSPGSVQPVALRALSSLQE